MKLKQLLILTFFILFHDSFALNSKLIPKKDKNVENISKKLVKIIQNYSKVPENAGIVVYDKTSGTFTSDLLKNVASKGGWKNIKISIAKNSDPNTDYSMDIILTGHLKLVILLIFLISQKCQPFCISDK